MTRKNANPDRLRSKMHQCPECCHVDKAEAFTRIALVEQDCDECGARFSSDVGWARFCSEKCRYTSYNRNRTAKAKAAKEAAS